MKNLIHKISLCCLILCMVLSFAVPAFAEETYTQPTLSAAKVTGAPGDIVEVAITMHENPGIVSMTLNVAYDGDAMELDYYWDEEEELNVVAIDGGLIGDYYHSDNYTANPYQLTWANDASRKNFKENGVIAVLKFKIKDTATAGTYPVVLSYTPNNYEIYDKDGEEVDFDLVAGSVTVGAAACTHAGKTAVPAVAPECEKPGNNLYYTCADCGKVLKADGITETTVEAEKLPALEHDMQKTADEVAPECEVAGKTAVYTCANGCGKTEAAL